MEILHWTIGPPLDTYIQDCLARVGRPVHWCYIDDLNIPGTNGHGGLHFHFGGHPSFLIAIRRSYTTEQAGPIIAHELTHEVLNCEGVPNVGTERQEFKPLASLISSCLSDGTIDLRLRAAGISQDFRHQHMSRQFQEALIKGPFIAGTINFELDVHELLLLDLVEGDYFRLLEFNSQNGYGADQLMAEVKLRRKLINPDALTDVQSQIESLHRLVSACPFGQFMTIV